MKSKERRSKSPLFPRNTLGGSVKRFTYLGIYPNLLDISTVKGDPEMGPGKYNYKIDAECLYKRSGGAYCWKQKLDTELWTKNLGYRCKEILIARREAKMSLGPGTYNLEIEKPKRHNVKVDLHFGKSERFKSYRETTPGPGTHHRDILKNSTVNLHSFTDVPTFEWAGLGPRFKDPIKTYWLPPNRYAVDSRGCIDATLRKRVSHLKGPYDIFTGPRDGTTIKNHFAPKKLDTPDYYYIDPSTADIPLHDKNKKRYGCFLKGNRFPKHMGLRMLMASISTCYKDPDDPSPAHYYITDRTWESEESQYAFGSNRPRGLGELPWKISPEPGRYGRSILKKTPKGPTYVFKSKTERFPTDKNAYMYD